MMKKEKDKECLKKNVFNKKITLLDKVNDFLFSTFSNPNHHDHHRCAVK